MLALDEDQMAEAIGAPFVPLGDAACKCIFATRTISPSVLFTRAARPWLHNIEQTNIMSAEDAVMMLDQDCRFRPDQRECDGGKFRIAGISFTRGEDGLYVVKAAGAFGEAAHGGSGFADDVFSFLVETRKALVADVEHRAQKSRLDAAFPCRWRVDNQGAGVDLEGIGRAAGLLP